MQALAGAAVLALLSGIGMATVPGGAGTRPEPMMAASSPDVPISGEMATQAQTIGGLMLGQAWPEGYGTTDLPAHMIVHYGLSSDDWRMANRTIYRIDTQTGAIVALVALITGDSFAIGQPVPAGYDIYNVPIAYRERWQDGPDALYRYADGRIYRIDPRTGRVAEAIDIPAIPPS